MGGLDDQCIAIEATNRMTHPRRRASRGWTLIEVDRSHGVPFAISHLESIYADTPYFQLVSREDLSSHAPRLTIQKAGVFGSRERERLQGFRREARLEVLITFKLR